MPAGRPAKSAKVLSVREISLTELFNVKRGSVPAVKKLRDSHHKMAQLFACGLKPGEVAELTGYSLTRVSLLRSDPAFDDLVDQKRGLDEAPLKDGMQAYYKMMLENGLKAERKLADKLDDDDQTEELSVRELISISRDSADRVGLSKRSVLTNVNVDFAQMLDRAIARTDTVKRIDLKAEGPVSSLQEPVRSLQAKPIEIDSPFKPNVMKFKRRI
jgi:hypothetical protein